MTEHPPTLRTRLVLALAMSLLPASALLADDQPLPAFKFKPVSAANPAGPSTWRTGLATHDGEVVWDRDFAQWVKKCQNDAKAAVAGTWSLMVRCTFTQCYAAGFLDELERVTQGRNNLKNFAGTASTRYYQGASADQSAVDTTKWNSRFAFAWQHRADIGSNPVQDLEVIATKTYNALLAGDGTVPLHPLIDQEHPQYLAGQGVAPGDLKGGDDAHKIAILFAGDPETRHRNNTTSVLAVLKDKYGFKDENIFILYGDFGPNDAIPGAAWASNAKATAANLEKALTDADGFVIKRIKAIANGQPLNDKTIKLYIWTTDHGTIDAPICFGVDVTTQGKPGTAVNIQALVQAATTWLYEGGAESNSLVFPQVENDLGPASLDSISSGYERLPVVPHPRYPDAFLPAFGVYFSVDHDLSGGKPHTGTERTLAKFRDPAAQVYVMTSDGNREVVAAQTLGLEDNLLAMFPVDNVSALMMEPAEDLFDGINPKSPIFYTLPDSPRIWVIDPWHPNLGGQPFKRYVFWDPAFDPDWPMGVVPPARLDALSMYVNTSENGRAKGACPMPGTPEDPTIPGAKDNLVYKPDVDKILFSVPRGDAFLGGSGCTLYLHWNKRIHVMYTCDQIGLRDSDDVNAIHAYADDGPYRVRISPSYNDEELEPPCLPDLNGDHKVNGADVGILLSAWGGNCPLADLDGNGHVDGADLALLLAAWGPCPEA